MENHTVALGERVINLQNVERKLHTKSEEVRVRCMRKKDIPQVIDIYREMGWHTGTHAVHTWFEVDPLAFKVAVSDTGKVLGVCCAVRHHADFHFIGFYIVRKNYRGMGVGVKVWNACMEHIGHRNAGLNAVPEKVEMYRMKSGFDVVVDEWSIQENDTLQDSIRPENLSDALPEGVTIAPYHASHLHLMSAYDSAICGYNRELLLKLNCKEKESRTLVAFQNGSCVGFGTVKRSVQGVPQVGPLYADDGVIAETMLRRLLLSHPLRKGFSMVTFTHNDAANELVRKIGCPATHKLPRIYKNSRQTSHWSGSANKVFAHFDINCSPV